MKKQGSKGWHPFGGVWGVPTNYSKYFWGEWRG